MPTLPGYSGYERVISPRVERGVTEQEVVGGRHASRVSQINTLQFGVSDRMVWFRTVCCPFAGFYIDRASPLVGGLPSSVGGSARRKEDPPLGSFRDQASMFGDIVWEEVVICCGLREVRSICQWESHQSFIKASVSCVLLLGGDWVQAHTTSPRGVRAQGFRRPEAAQSRTFFTRKFRQLRPVLQGKGSGQC